MRYFEKSNSFQKVNEKPQSHDSLFTDDPASTAYVELRQDYKKFERAILLADFRRPVGSGNRFFLKGDDKSCAKRCDETRDRRGVGPYCHCDRLCPLYKDCCVDYWPR